MNWQRLIELQRQGAMTTLEARVWVLQRVEPNNVEECLSALPPDLRDALVGWCQRMPWNEEGWDKTVSIDGGVIYRSGVTEQEMERTRDENRAASRRGVEIIRQYLHLRPPAEENRAGP